MENSSLNQILPKVNQGQRVDHQVKSKDHLPRRRDQVVCREQLRVEGFLPRDFFVRECIQFFVFRLMCDWTGEGKIERKWKPRDETGKKKTEGLIVRLIHVFYKIYNYKLQQN